MNRGRAALARRTVGIVSAASVALVAWLGMQSQGQVPPRAATATRARALWQQTLRAEADVPVRAQAVVTRWTSRGKVASRQTLQIVEGTGGRYRFTYLSPKSVRGRIVVSDGHTVSQYEPARQAILRRPAASPLRLPTHPAGILSLALPLTIDGRKTYLLEARDARTGRVRERRWVDAATSRSLRVEEYDRATGRLLRRVVLSAVHFGDAPVPATFQPRFPQTAHVVPPHSVTPPPTATRLGLPARLTGGYTLRRLVAPLPHAPVARYQALYSNGKHTVSLFVAPGTPSYPTPPWRPLTLAPGVTAHVREDPRHGGTALAWNRNGRHYIAVARLPLPQFPPLATSP